MSQSFTALFHKDSTECVQAVSSGSQQTAEKERHIWYCSPTECLLKAFTATRCMDGAGVDTSDILEKVIYLCVNDEQRVLVPSS